MNKNRIWIMIVIVVILIVACRQQNEQFSFIPSSVVRFKTESELTDYINLKISIPDIEGYDEVTYYAKDTYYALVEYCNADNRIYVYYSLEQFIDSEDPYLAYTKYLKKNGVYEKTQIIESEKGSFPVSLVGKNQPDIEMSSFCAAQWGDYSINYYLLSEENLPTEQLIPIIERIGTDNPTH